jgi:hypothetical protein
MKNSILNILFLTVASIAFTINADDCKKRRSSSKRSSRNTKSSYSKNCKKPVNHTNRKMKTCSTKSNSCAKKDVRQNKSARRDCCE